MNWEDWPTTKLTSFDTVLETAHQFDSLRITPQHIASKDRGLPHSDHPWACSHMSSWRWWANGTVYVPGFGNLKMNSHSMGQVGAKIGIKVPKFLGPIMSDPKLIQQTLTPHLRARKDDEELIVKIVARQLNDQEKKKPQIGVDGILRGIVGPKYAEIRDVELLEAMQKTGGSAMEEYSVTYNRRTEATTFLTFVKNKPTNLPILHEKGDEVLGGFKCWNSEVGSRSIGAAMFLHRLVCTNGMVIDVPGDRLLYRKHTPMEDGELERLLRQMWLELPIREEIIAGQTELIHDVMIADPATEIRQFLRAQPKYVQNAVIRAFDEEPVNTAYGVLQAITRTGVALRDNPERQHDLEELGGSYMLHAFQQAFQQAA